MNTISVNEMRSVDGGYRVICFKCGQRARYTSKLKVSGFYLMHMHWTKSGYAGWDLRYANATKSYG